MTLVLAAPLALQASLMIADEAFFHRVRGLTRWERIGHPLDTLTVLACFAWVLLVPYGPRALRVYVGLAIFSCIFVTKDELVHKRLCSGAEQWMHALLFLLHPVVFLVLALAWPDLVPFPRAADAATAPASAVPSIVRAQFAGALLFFAYQALYWNVPRSLPCKVSHPPRAP